MWLDPNFLEDFNWAESLSHIKSLRLEKSSPQKETDHLKNHAPRSSMGFKSKEIIIVAPLVLNELPKYWDKMVMFATIGNEPFMYGTLFQHLAVIFYFCRRLFIGDPTALPVPMNHYAVDEKNWKPIRWGSVAKWYFQSLMLHTTSVARNSNMFYSVRIKYQLKHL